MAINSDDPPNTVDELTAAGEPRRRRARRARRGALRAGSRPVREALGLPRRARGRARRRRPARVPCATRSSSTTQPPTDELLAELTATEEGARAALDVLVRMRRHADAAPLAERLGDIDRAIDLYTRARRDLDAARLLEAAGPRPRRRPAAREARSTLATDGERAPIQLALGRILARRGAYPEAARLLQDARKTPALRAEAQRHLIATLAAMGLRDGARDALLELRATDRPRVRPISTPTCARGATRPPSARPRAIARWSPAATGSTACSAPAPRAACSSPPTRSPGGRSRSRCSSPPARAAARRTSGSCARRGSRARCATHRSSRSTTSRSSAASW